MRFAIVDTGGTIRQINDALGDVDTIDQINARLTGLTAIVCDQSIQISSDKYDWDTKQFIASPS